jgi:4-amino-4-deoxy-L-arabinose transferase-like glycosyltransferase
MARRIAFGGLVLLAVALFFVGLGNRPFLDYDEAIYARITHDTQLSGDPFILSRAGQPFFEKPPLYFWSSMALDSMLHNPEWSYRLTSALAGVLCIIFTMLLAFEISGAVAAAFWSGAILLTTGAFVEASRQMRLDIPVVASIVLASYCFTRGMRDRRWLVGVGIAIAIGVLFKIVIALLAGVFMLAWATVHRDIRWIKEPWLWIGGLAGLLILAPWHIYETMHFGAQFWDGYLWHNVVNRVGGDVLGGSLSVANFAKFVLVFTAPWSVAVVAGLVVLAARRNPVRWEGEMRQIGVVGLTTVLIAAVFALSSTRIFYYLLPAYPFMAITLALISEEIRARVSKTIFAALITVMAIDDAIAADEANAGLILAANPEPTRVLTYQWPYWDTLGYYSGGRPIGVIGDGDVIKESYYLVVHSEGNYSYPPSYKARLTTMYQGPALTMYKFTY